MPFKSLQYLFILLCISSLGTGRAANAQSLSSAIYTPNSPFDPNSTRIPISLKTDPQGNSYFLMQDRAYLPLPAPSPRFSGIATIIKYSPSGTSLWRRRFQAGNIFGGGWSQILEYDSTNNRILLLTDVDSVATTSGLAYSHLRIDCISTTGAHVWSRLIKYPYKLEGKGIKAINGKIYINFSFNNFLNPPIGTNTDSITSKNLRHALLCLRPNGATAFCRELAVKVADDPALTGRGLSAVGLCPTPTGLLWMGTNNIISFRGNFNRYVVIEMDTLGRNQTARLLTTSVTNYLNSAFRFANGHLYYAGTQQNGFTGQNTFRNIIGRLRYPSFDYANGATFANGPIFNNLTVIAESQWAVLSNKEVAINVWGLNFSTIGGVPNGTSAAYSVRFDTNFAVRHSFDYRGPCKAPFLGSVGGLIAPLPSGRYIAANYVDGDPSFGYPQIGIFAPDTSDRICRLQSPAPTIIVDQSGAGFSVYAAVPLPASLPDLALANEGLSVYLDSANAPNLRQICSASTVPGYSILGPDTNVCALPYTLALGFSTPSSIDGGPFLPGQTNISFSTIGKHTITYFDTCNASNWITDTLTITTSATPTITTIPRDTLNLCATDSAAIIGFAPLPGLRYRWEPPIALSNPDVWSPTVFARNLPPNVVQTYTLFYSTPGTGCETKTATRKVAARPFPTGRIDTLPISLLRVTYAGGSLLRWQLTNGFLGGSPSADTISVRWESPWLPTQGAKAFLRSPFGCASVVSWLRPKPLAPPIIPPPLPDEEVFNIISANGDITNDFFTIKNARDTVIYPLQIANRWGKIIYNAPYAPNNWPSKSTEAGTYYFTVKARNKTLRGWVEVVR